jgi:hypothetical protein
VLREQFVAALLEVEQPKDEGRAQLLHVVQPASGREYALA